MHYTQDPPELIDLKHELMTGYHPTLIQSMNDLGFGPNNLSDAIVHIATHCGRLVEGVYTWEDKLELCRKLAIDLIEKRESPTDIKPIIHLN